MAGSGGSPVVPVLSSPLVSAVVGSLVAGSLDGLVVASDLMAAGALGVLNARGRSVPGDVKVIGFDDLGVAVSTNPPLTTMSNPVVEMSRVAGELLLEQIAGLTTSFEPRIFGAEVVVRESA